MDSIRYIDKVIAHWEDVHIKCLDESDSLKLNDLYKQQTNFIDDLRGIKHLIQSHQTSRKSNIEILDMLNDVMNLGMTLRENQLNGSDNRSGLEVLQSYIDRNLK